MNQEELLDLRVLIVDDEPVNIALLEDMLTFSGYRQVVSTTDPRRALAMCREKRPDLVLLDLNMPYLDGFAVMKQLSAAYPEEECLPILVLTADISLETKRRALAAGATDFLTKPFDTVEVLLRIKNLLRTRYQHLEITEQKDLLEDRVEARTAELREALTQLQQAQGQIIQQERLSALGSMTAGIAHDFNNVLSLILGYSEMLTRMLARPNGAQLAAPLLDTIISAAQDAARMFSRLREFYRPAEKGHPRQMIDLNALVEQTVALTRPRWYGQALGQGITIRMAFEPGADLPELLADAAELREMLTNLIFNAVDAMPQGGTLTLCTRQAAGALVLEVADTGTGMSEETRRRCLEPFFTTKGERGTGLGLAMVYGTVQRHGGTIALHSAPGQGTRFELHLPLREEEAEKPASAPAPIQVARRVLVVDDQPVLAEILRHYLKRDGHRVETATNAAEALEKFRAPEAGFELVITDKVMPGLNGEELAAELKRLSPTVQVILVSGFGELDAAMESSHPAVDLSLVKPLTQEALRQGVQTVMQTRLPSPPPTPTIPVLPSEDHRIQKRQMLPNQRMNGHLKLNSR